MKTYPAGTTREDWDRYNEKVKSHEQFINNYKFFLDRICNHLDWLNKKEDGWWTPEEIRRVISNEISRANSMDTPNEPGYYRANND